MSAEILRIECDAHKKGLIKDVRNNQDLAIWRGADVELQLALSQGKEFIDPNDVTSVVIELKDELASPSDPSIWRTVVTNINAAFTPALWRDNTEFMLSAIIPVSITQRLIPKSYWLIVKHVGAFTTTHLSHLVKVRESHSGSAHTYNFDAGGTVISGQTSSATVTEAIRSTSETVTVAVPTNFTSSDYASHVVIGDGSSVELSDTVQLNASSITFTVLTSPLADSSHEISVTFQKITA